MTVEAEPGAGAVPLSSALQPGAAFSNLAALRKAHQDLRDVAAAALSSPDVAERIRTFLGNARKAGAMLVDPGERRVAQGILDFWSAELAGNPSATQEDFVPVMLAPPDAVQTFSRPDSPAAAETPAPAPKVDQRALVRLSAMARQWRDSGKQPGYLLTGETIEEAAKFKDQDSNLAEFVEASQKAVDHQRRIRTIAYSGIMGAMVALAAAGAALWYFSVLLKASERLIVQSATKGSDPALALEWLDLFQPLLPPYDFSGIKLANVSAPRLRLYAPNFSGAEFSKVAFPRAILPAASFVDSDFSFDGSGDNDFGGAVLRQAQFRGARIAATSFEGADLYRASFDRAILCDVDFTGANLRTASFWAVTSNDATKETLKKTAWWQAQGWPWSEIEKLAPPHQAPANASDDDRLRSSLRSSRGFRNDIQRTIGDFQRSSAGTIERALALNDFAWTEAVWGLDIDVNAAKPAPSDPCAATDLPSSAEQAAEQAVCIVNKLNQDGDDKGKYTSLLSNLRDTLAYVLLQNNEIPQALEIYADIGRDDPKSLEGTDTSFRYAIAQYAGGLDKATAIATLKNAVEDGRYQPTHELQTLKDLIFPVKEFVDVLRASSNRLWPTVPSQSPCPAHKPAASK
ncbi:MAG TPA: pentapeptide repeat-containing protein [Bradyrhizobium sp.]|uniref:pentapeptide repeat-containing protein n=1 Tax=Bradyrhizobium sp. TaxID=376 RepID=UPI002B8EA5B0|nr:pentapeptide repeat-containing protein [Bradyrhizobium sp.]HTB02749.1 pentapeptide repeat-containing protein [Bradyrhizobium sp.]